MTQLILIRHGETLWNTERRMQGQLDSPLTNRGVWRGHERGVRKGELWFAAVDSSGLPGALATAESAVGGMTMPVLTSGFSGIPAFLVFQHGRVAVQQAGAVRHTELLRWVEQARAAA